MKPAKFDFYAPDHEDEILGLLAEYSDDVRPLAGGQSLVPLMNLRIVQPGVIVSMRRCPGLDFMSEADGHIAFGAMARQGAAEDSDVVRRHLPLLAAALPHVGVRASRNFGTICGSLAHADPLAELPSVAAALDATFVIARAGGRREVSADAFFESALTTCIEPGEMLREVRFPKAPENARSAFFEVGNRAHGFAVSGVATHLEVGIDGRCAMARIAAMGMGEPTLRLTEAERLLEGETPSGALIDEAAAAAAASVNPFNDIHASATYRRRLLRVLVKRTLNGALGRAAC